MGPLEASALSAPGASDDVETASCPKDRFDPEAFARFESYLLQLDQVALDRTTFVRELDGDRQHLDMGCGTGGFTRDVLLPLCGSDTRILGADISPAMLDFARRNNAQLDQVALDRTTFVRELDGDRQHLDMGCGTGGFTRDVLLPLCGSDTRILGADISPAMLDFARRNNAQGRIMYDLLDINSDAETSAFLAKYGQFERVYSFLCFHMVKDQTAAFRRIGHLLSTEGECLVTAVVTNPAMDTWLDLQRMPQWKNLIPDPMTVLTSSAVRFHYSGTRDQIEEETRQCVTDAGLECIACEVIDCIWSLPDIGHFCDMYTAAFLMDVNLEQHQRDALIAAYTEILQTRMKKAPSGWELTVGIYRVHARLR